MSKFKPFDIVLASFKSYPPWPAIVLQSKSGAKGLWRYTVFCYGDHSEHQVAESNLKLLSDNPSARKRTEKDVGKAFTELDSFPDIYKSSSPTYLALNPASVIAEDSLAPSLILQKIAFTQDELNRTQVNLTAEISRQVKAKLSDPDTANQAIDIIVKKIHDAISIDYNPKFQEIEKSLKGLFAMVKSLESRILSLESKVDDFEQEKMLDCLVMNGVRQRPGNDLKKEVSVIIKDKMLVPGFEVNNIVNVYRFSLNDSNDQSKVSPVLIRFKNVELARVVFKEKTKLAKSGIFLSESLTKKRREILNAARDCFGKFNVWTDRGQILAKPPGQSMIRKIRSFTDCA